MGGGLLSTCWVRLADVSTGFTIVLWMLGRNGNRTAREVNRKAMDHTDGGGGWWWWWGGGMIAHESFLFFNRSINWRELFHDQRFMLYNKHQDCATLRVHLCSQSWYRMEGLGGHAVVI